MKFGKKPTKQNKAPSQNNKPRRGFPSLPQMKFGDKPTKQNKAPSQNNKPRRGSPALPQMKFGDKPRRAPSPQTPNHIPSHPFQLEFRFPAPIPYSVRIIQLIRPRPSDIVSKIRLIDNLKVRQHPLNRCSDFFW